MKKTLINKRWIFFVTMFSFLVLLGIFTLEEEIGISIAIITLGLILILGYALIIPNSYTFSQEGITVRYCFGLKTFLCWKDVKHIEDHYSGGKGFPWWRSYEIAYFKTKYREHNLDRCRTQFELVRDMNRKWEQMKNIVNKYL